MKIKSLPLLFVAFLTLAGCGYELVREPGILADGGAAKSASGMAEGITSLNVPVFRNLSFEPQVPLFFTEAFSRELASSGLVQINKSASDATLQGTVTSIGTTLSSLNAQGLAVSKTVTAAVTLTLSRQGNIVKTWSFGDSETYTANNINSEDFNKRAALTRIAERMARRFHAQLVMTPRT
jgi:hypothetical protein